MPSVEKMLKPRWCLPGEGLSGWVVIHADHRDVIGLKHLEHTKIKCIETDKSVYCRVRGPGRRPNSGYNQEYGIETVKESIFMDAYYQRKLAIDNTKMNKSKMSFKINKPKKLIKFCYILRAGLAHPNDGVKIGAWLGLLSIILGTLSIILAIFI